MCIRDRFIADYTRGEGYEHDGPYWAPYRCLYSRNIDNLFMAGRNISVTHEALGAVRVMKTTGTMGEIVGMAAAICKRENCSPRDVYDKHLKSLKALMRLGAGRHDPQMANADGVIMLEARSAITRGKLLRYEADRNCLGYWRNTDDFVEWKFQADDRARYELALEYACPKDEAGSEYEVRIASRQEIAGDAAIVEQRVVDRPIVIGARVASTGSWNDYAVIRVSTIELSPGDHRITVHSMKPTGPLMKLRSVRLAPRP